MKAFNDYAEINTDMASEKLPVGGYVLKVMSVKYEAGTNGNSDQVVLAFDVAEGEYAGFFKKQYEANTDENKKWKGSVRIYVPVDDGSEKDGWTKKSFKRWMEAFEDSNPGYKWNWDENTLKGKLIGGIFGEVLKTMTDENGQDKDITYVTLRFPASVANIRNNNFKIPDAQDKRRAANTSAPTADGFANVPVGADGDIPF